MLDDLTIYKNENIIWIYEKQALILKSESEM